MYYRGVQNLYAIINKEQHGRKVETSSVNTSKTTKSWLAQNTLKEKKENNNQQYLELIQEGDKSVPSGRNIANVVELRRNEHPSI